MPGDKLFDETLLSNFENDNYDIALYGPNGFFRSYKGDKNDAPVFIHFMYDDANRGKAGKKPAYTGKIVMSFSNQDLKKRYTIKIVDNAYRQHEPIVKDIPSANESHDPVVILLDTNSSFGWYDFSVFVESNTVFEKRYAGHIETGAASKSDPFMGGV